MNNCISIISRDFWLEDQMVEECCVLFMAFENNDFLSASYNDEVCIWELAQSREMPSVGDVQGDKEFKYVHKQCIPQNLDSCGDLESYAVSNRNTLTIKFTSGLEVELIYEPITEKTRLRVNA